MKILLFETNKGAGRTDFYYSNEDWNRWKQRGLKYGDSGSVLVGITGEYLHYKTFGTIENPL